jgi:muramidase (phage lysozyme)
MRSKNIQAFLDTIAVSELGEKLVKLSDNGYNVIVGSTPAKPDLFTSYKDHPRKMVKLPNGITSSAAGRYQILKRYFDIYKGLLKLTSFDPASQDKIALQLIKECKALDDVEAGRFDVAIDKCKSRWASFPGANYTNQNMHTMEHLRSVFLKYGGKLAEAV